MYDICFAAQESDKSFKEARPLLVMTSPDSF